MAKKVKKVKSVTLWDCYVDEGVINWNHVKVSPMTYKIAKSRQDWLRNEPGNKYWTVLSGWDKGTILITNSNIQGGWRLTKKEAAKSRLSQTKISYNSSLDELQYIMDNIKALEREL